METLTIRLRQQDGGTWEAYCVEEYEAYGSDSVSCADEDPGLAAKCVLGDDRLRERFGIPLEK